MNRTWILLLVLTLPLAGCGRGETPKEKEEVGHDEAEEGEEHAKPAKPAKPADAEQEGVLAIDAEVLRDLKLTTFPAELRPGGEGVTALGELKVNESAYAEVGAPIPGRIVRLVASPGQAVRRGQPLAELQSVELGQARAQRTAALARAGLARQTVERKRGLAAERIVSRGELQRAEAAAAESEAELKAAEAAVEALGVGGGGPGGLSGFALLSPISGTVLERTAVQGQAADPSRSLFRIGDLSRLWLIVQAPERDVVRVRVGSPSEIALAALPGQKLRGTVDWVGREVDPHSRTVPIRLVVPNEDGRLKPGMFATAWLATGAEGERVVAVPAAALQRMDDRWIVFLPLGPPGEGRFEVRPVERGRDLGDEVAILSGLKPGERVVVEGAFVLRAEAGKKEGGGEHHH
jgi:cobalt-zinc-cadmium efflux system membrane fusion protein